VFKLSSMLHADMLTSLTNIFYYIKGLDSFMGDNLKLILFSNICLIVTVYSLLLIINHERISFGVSGTYCK